MHKKRYEFLNALAGNLFDKPKTAFIKIGIKDGMTHATLMPGWIRISRSIVENCLAQKYVRLEKGQVKLTEEGYNAVCDYRERFVGDGE